jgi:hypothetical protein
MLFAIWHSYNKNKFEKNNNKTKITGDPGKQELLITRELDAPRKLVFKAYTDPELYVQWLGATKTKDDA